MTSIRAVGLMSGGLDSALAARLLLDQGIEVLGLHLESPTSCRSDVREVARDLGIELVSRPKGEEYLRLLRHPRWGYGKNMNPCVDCRVFMFHLGRPYLEEFGAGFLFTGEVFDHTPEESTHEDDLTLLKLGRHFRFEDGSKIVLGRNEEENRRLAEFERADRWLVQPDHFSGPHALVCGGPGEPGLTRAIELIRRYTREPDPALRVRWREGE